MSILKGLSPIISLVLTSISLTGISVVEAKAVPNPETASLQATSEIPVLDDRVASVWLETPTGEDSAEPSIRRECTAGYLGDNWWLTAHHCVALDLNTPGYLQQSDGEIAGIASIHTLSDHDDVALIKVGDGISATPFRLPTKSLSEGDQATLVGFGGDHDYASTATTEIIGKIDELDFGITTYSKLFEASSITDSRSCSGDSGGPIYIGDIIYAVHTAGGYNPACKGGEGKTMWHTDLLPRADWISQTMFAEKGLTRSEQKHADVGRSLASKPQDQPKAPQLGISGSSLLGSSSKGASW